MWYYKFDSNEFKITEGESSVIAGVWNKSKFEGFARAWRENNRVSEDQFNNYGSLVIDGQRYYDYDEFLKAHDEYYGDI